MPLVERNSLTRQPIPGTITVMKRCVFAGAGRLASLLLLAWVAAPGAGAQTSSAARTVWEGAYTEQQAMRGQIAYAQSCAGCHALAAEGRAPLVGEPFWKSFSQKTVGDLLEFVSKYMPNGAPGSLSAASYQDIVALMLRANGFPAGTTELSAETGAGVRIVPQDGSTELPANALARVVGCLAGNESGWVLTHATSPERAEIPPLEPNGTRPLGNRTMPLKFVVTRLDALAGSRVVVNGLLIGTGGADGINVTTVSRAAPACP